jgi:DNA-directed RNA polymerase sigma subunit (sigma70/sigma32)
MLGLSRQRVTQIKQQAVRRLKANDQLREMAEE